LCTENNKNKTCSDYILNYTNYEFYPMELQINAVFFLFLITVN
jgi:hypothetical protein